MNRFAKFVILIACLFFVSKVEAGTLRPESWNYALIGIGGMGMVLGGVVVLSTTCPPLLVVAVLSGSVVAVGMGAIDEIHEAVTDKTPESSFASEVASWRDVNDQMQRQHDQDNRIRMSEENAKGIKANIKQNLKNIGAWFQDLIGSKPANAGELKPLQPLDQFIAENASSRISNRGNIRKQRKNVSPKRGRKEKSQSGSTELRPDLHGLDLDDANGDWCKCAVPGCSANMDVKTGMVIFGCSKCKKVNVKYAKMALELDQNMKVAGTTPTWYGQNAEANAHRAAAGK